jgi:hypothetical protein
MFDLPAPDLAVPLKDRTGGAQSHDAWRRDIDQLLNAVLPGDHRHERPGAIDEFRHAIDALITLTLNVRASREH